MNKDEYNAQQNPSFEEPESETPKQNSEYAEDERPQTEQAKEKEFAFVGIDPEKYAEKSAIKRTALVVGFCFLLVTALIFVLGIGIGLALSVAMSISPEVGEIYNDAAIQTVMQIVFSALVFTVPFILVPRLSGERISDLISFKKPEKKSFLPLFLFGISFCAFANIAVSQAGAIFESFGINYNVDFGENPKGVFGFLLSIIATVIMPALVEEFALRGVTLGILRRFGDSFAVVTTAGLFGLMHSNFQQIPFAFLVGLVLGYITVKSGTIWVAVAVHAFNNFVSVIIDYFLSPLSNTAVNIIYMFFLVICLVLGLAALLSGKTKAEDFKFTTAQTKATEKEKYKYFFTSVPIIIYTVVCLIESCAFFV